MIFKRFIYFFTLVLFIFTSCKTKSAVTGSTTRTMSVNKVIKRHYANDFNKETISAKLRVKYKGKSNLPSVTASLRLQKDTTIWISLSKLGFPIGKALITNNKVSYYEKINRTYFEGDFTLLSNWLGTDLDFKKVQNLLLGQAILNLKDDKYESTLNDNVFDLTPKKANALFDILFSINSTHFKVNKQLVQQDGKTLTVGYHNYEKIDGVTFPKKVQITALDGKYITTVDVDYRSVEFNKSLRFPFTIPNGYKEIVLK
jgi:hypothetical protein